MTCDHQLIFDVGLHRGEDTEFYLKKGYRVVGFEANPHLVRYCRSRFADEIKSGRLQVIEGAITSEIDETNRAKFYINKDVSVWSTTKMDWAERNERAGAESELVEVDCVNMSDIFSKFGVPFYLKIDIEGGDSAVLDVLRLCPDRPMYISIEVNSISESSTQRDITTLCDLGYKQFQLVPQGRIQGSSIYTKTLQEEPFEHLFPVDSSGPFGYDLNGVWVDDHTILTSLTPPFDPWQDIHASLLKCERINLALNRPATQSSTSEWSTALEPEADARVANNGDTFSTDSCHTAVEWNPWWEVDLGEHCIVDGITLYNRFEALDRLSNFSVLNSPNGKDWDILFCKSDNSAFSGCTINSITPKLSRFIRIRLDGHNCLHFRECQVFGKRLGATTESLDPCNDTCLVSSSICSYGLDMKRILEAYMSRGGPKGLHIGCGVHILSGWLNADLFPQKPEVIFLDATKRFDFPDNTFDFVFSEHMIEHIGYPDALMMLKECQRVLRPGGMVRVTTPDLESIIDIYQRSRTALHADYLRWSRKHFLKDSLSDSPGFFFNHFVRGWGHQFIYDRTTLSITLIKAGFVTVEERTLNDSDEEYLRNLEAVGRMPPGFLQLESLTMEGRKPL